jgi:hypothetical protein
MALDIRTQALSLLLACALGGGLGLLYDLLGPLRLRGGAALWDLVFCVSAALSAFLFAMRADSGALGTGELLAALLGLLLYFQLLSPTLRPLIRACAEKIGVICINTQRFAKKIAFGAKKLFQKRRE